MVPLIYGYINHMVISTYKQNIKRQHVLKSLLLVFQCNISLKTFKGFSFYEDGNPAKCSTRRSYGIRNQRLEKRHKNTHAHIHKTSTKHTHTHLKCLLRFKRSYFPFIESRKNLFSIKGGETFFGSQILFMKILF